MTSQVPKEPLNQDQTSRRPVLFQQVSAPQRGPGSFGEQAPRQDLFNQGCCCHNRRIFSSQSQGFVYLILHVKFTVTTVPISYLLHVGTTEQTKNPTPSRNEDPHLRRPLLGVGRRPPRPARRHRPGRNRGPVLRPRRREGTRMWRDQSLPPSEVLRRPGLRAGQRPEALRRTILPPPSSHVRRREREGDQLRR